MFPLRLSRSTIGLVIFGVLAVIVLLLSSVRVAGTGGGTDLPIMATRKTGGDYHLAASSFDRSTGDYTLTIKEEW